MNKDYFSTPGFFIDSLPDLSGPDCRELIRHIEISAGASDIYVWLKQLRIAPYSYDFLDNRGIRSPEYIIENLPPLRINSHFLLVFHILGFEENRFIAGRFCVPVNPPVNLVMKEMFIEYRIQGTGSGAVLWCKIKGRFKNDVVSKGFFDIFSAVNKVMTKRQFRRIKDLSELNAAGIIKTGVYDLTNYHPASGVHWWIFCRRANCKGLII
jgi:hypothetical protein